MDQLGWTQYTKVFLGLGSPKWDMVSRCGLVVLPGPALPVSSLSQDMTFAFAEFQEGPVGLILHPAEWQPCSPIWCCPQNAKTHRWLWEPPRQTSGGRKKKKRNKAPQVPQGTPHVSGTLSFSHRHKPLGAFTGWRGMVIPHPSQAVSQPREGDLVAQHPPTESLKHFPTAN